jgi:hypothetical protein
MRPRGVRTLRRAFFGGLLLLVGIVVGRWLSTTRVTTTALSPDDKWQAVLVERGSYLDRNFDVRLGPTGGVSSSFVPIFSSPDEGRPIGSERFIWSKDSNYLLLVGRQFAVEGQTRMQTGEDLYLLYHLPTKRLLCNARQVSAQRFSFADLAKIEFTERVQETDSAR